MIEPLGLLFEILKFLGVPEIGAAEFLKLIAPELLLLRSLLFLTL